LSQSSSTATGALKGAAIAITLLSILVFATVGYSGYEFYTSVAASPTASLGHASASWDNGTLTVSGAQTFKNEGLYPLQLSASLNGSSGEGYLGSSTSPMNTISPSSSGIFNLSMSLDPYASGNRAASTLLYNGSYTTFRLGIHASLVPFATIGAEENSSVYISPFVANLTVASTAESVQGLNVLMTFQNLETSPVTYSMFLASTSTGSSGMVNGTAQPGQPESVAFLIGGVDLAQGTYKFVLNTECFGADLTIPVEVTVS
jgi:hypothetical protein